MTIIPDLIAHGSTTLGSFSLHGLPPRAGPSDSFSYETRLARPLPAALERLKQGAEYAEAV